ncbi:MAG: YceI family protein [Flavobacteriales bacterium]|nr:YceI family protein [Flavobacteriales bacterium]
MKKYILLSILVGLFQFSFSQNLYKATSGEISFFSETPLENIEAINKKVKALINTKNGELAFIVTNVGFHFEKPLMEEHFNENYIESDKYKVSMFKGKIVEKIDYSVDGTYQVTVKGKLNLHGVEKEREIKGVITIKDGKINVTSEFVLKLSDHKIRIPKVVTKKIAEEVKIKVNLNFELKN